MSPAIEQDSRMEFFKILVQSTAPDSTYACPTCGSVPLNPEDRKRALFAGVPTEPRERTMS